MLRSGPLEDLYEVTHQAVQIIINADGAVQKKKKEEEKYYY